jgi:hypothetical protein
MYSIEQLGGRGIRGTFHRDHLKSLNLAHLTYYYPKKPSYQFIRPGELQKGEKVIDKNNKEWMSRG